MKDLESIKQELRNDLLEEGYWGDLAKRFGSQLKNYVFTGNSRVAPATAVVSQSQLYQKIKTEAQKFSTRFIADLKKIATILNDQNLVTYSDKFSQITLTEMMANPAAGTMGSPPNAKGKARADAKKASAKPTAPPAMPVAKPQPKSVVKPTLPPEFIDLKKSVNDFIIGLSKLAGINVANVTNAMQGILMTNQMTEEEKKKLKVFVQKHLQVIKYLREKLSKLPPKTTTPQKAPSKKPTSLTAPPESQKGDSGDYSIEEDKKKVNEYSTVENWRSKGQPVLVAFFNSATGKNDVQKGTIVEPQNTQVQVKLDNPSWKTVMVPWKFVRPIALK
jgi:hypothetical protein